MGQDIVQVRGHQQGGVAMLAPRVSDNLEMQLDIQRFHLIHRRATYLKRQA